MIKSETSKTTGLKPKSSLKENKAGTKKESKPTQPTQNSTLSKKAAPTKSSAKTEALKTVQGQPEVNENQEFSKTTELRFEFIQAIQTQDYKKALEIAEQIKKEEPNNALIAHFQEFLNQNMTSLTEPETEEIEEDGEEEKDEEGEGDENDSDEDDDDEEDKSDEDSDEDDEDEDENDGENNVEKEVSDASTADQTQRTIS